MRRSLTALIAILVCLPVGWLAFGLPLPWMKTLGPSVVDVPPGDVEFAWLHTTTNAATWERFVKGIHRVSLSITDLEIDDSSAFPNDTHAVPEVVIRKAGRDGAIRVRWYKLSNEATAADWVGMLSRRDRPPLALIGGGSTDRAVELARAMAAVTTWPTSAPLLFITTASAEKVAATDETSVEQPLIKIYPDRSFRFCFSNRQMAAATVDLVWGRDDLRPTAAGMAKPKAIVLHWDDDPFSLDLRDQFRSILFSKADLVKWSEPLPFSVGGTIAANRYEQRAAEFVIDTLRDDPKQRAVLVLPTVTAPARRLLRTICEREPNARRQLVVLNGDGIPLNAVGRDGPFLWPIDQIPVPLVLFAHANPFGWDDSQTQDRSRLKPSTSTEDVLHFSGIAAMAIDAAFGPATIVSDSDELKKQLIARYPTYFDDDGNRLGGSGEFVAVLRPRDGTTAPRIDVWRHTDRWSAVTTIPLPIAERAP